VETGLYADFCMFLSMGATTVVKLKGPAAVWEWCPTLSVYWMTGTPVQLVVMPVTGGVLDCYNT